MKAITVIAIATFACWVIVALIFPHNSNATPAFFSSTDNISDPYFEEINLNTLIQYLDDQSKEEYIIYIGRNDCGECDIFEKKVTKILKENDYGLLTYYTSQDRDGSRSDEMYALLDKYQVFSVPSVILIRDQKLIRVWNEPINQLAEIESFLK